MLGAKVVKEQLGNSEELPSETQTPKLSLRRCYPEIIRLKTAGDEEAIKPLPLDQEWVIKNRVRVERE
jgi:hypothetical protein